MFLSKGALRVNNGSAIGYSGRLLNGNQTDIAVLEQLNEEMRQELVELEKIFGDLTARYEVIEKDIQRIVELLGNVYRESAGSQA